MRYMVCVVLLCVVLALSGTSAFCLDQQDMKTALSRINAAAATASGFSVDPGKTALLIMDYENDIVGMLAEGVRNPMVERADVVLKAARYAKIPVIYVTVRFREGYPEVNPLNKMFSVLKRTGRFVEGTPGAEIDARIAPQPGDIVVTKRRVGAFSTTDLESILRAKNVNNLVLFGISTSGVVLSTVRWAADMDYSMAVVSDLCADLDPEVNRVLLEKVFPRQAAVMTSNELLKAIGQK